MNSKCDKIIAVIISLFLLSFTFIYIVSNKSNNINEMENRVLQSKPNFSLKSLFNGKYIQSVENYLTDYFPFRNSFISIKTFTEKVTLKSEINDVYLGKDNYLIEKYNKNEDVDKIVELINNFKNKVVYANINLLLVPNSITINEDKLPLFAPKAKQIETTDNIYSKVKVNKINVYNILLDKNKQYQMFYYLDHHWTSYGAYYAYTLFCLSNNIEPLEINDFDIKEVTNNFNGTLYSKSGVYNNTPDKIHIFNYDNNLKVEYINYLTNEVYKVTSSLYELSYLEGKDKYNIFLDGINHNLVVITNNDIKNNKELLVIKDSYGNSIIPFLVNHYSKIHVIDLRNYDSDVSTYIKENNIKDVLILYNLNTINETGIDNLR